MHELIHLQPNLTNFQPNQHCKFNLPHSYKNTNDVLSWYLFYRETLSMWGNPSLCALFSVFSDSAYVRNKNAKVNSLNSILESYPFRQPSLKWCYLDRESNPRLKMSVFELSLDSLYRQGRYQAMYQMIANKNVPQMVQIQLWFTN